MKLMQGFGWIITEEEKRELEKAMNVGKSRNNKPNKFQNTDIINNKTIHQMFSKKSNSADIQKKTTF